jgi:hypothetical protein
VSEEIPEAVRARINSHLDSVESQLSKAAVPREKRRGIVDDLETHILELVKSSAHQPVTVDEIDAMIARLDPPGAYGGETVVVGEVGAAPAESRLCPQAKRGLFWIFLAIASQLFIFLGMEVRTVTYYPNGLPPTPPQPSIWIPVLLAAMSVIALIAPVVGTSLGWIAVGHIRRHGDRFYGMILAVLEAVFYPLIVIWTGAFVFWYCVVVAYYDTPDVPYRGRSACLIGGSITAVAITVALCWVLHRATTRRSAEIQVPAVPVR